MPEKLSFKEEQIQSLFGHEAAEDEDPKRLREYYFKSATYDQVVTDLPVRILVGHKGIGKSALFRVAIAEQIESGKIIVEIKPDDIAELSTNEGARLDFLSLIRNWKVGLKEIIARKAATRLGLPVSQVSAAYSERQEILPSLRKVITHGYAPGGPHAPVVEQFISRNQVTVYLDDLDRGWEGDKQSVTRISALLSAIRDLANEERGLNFRISLRSDVYFLVRTSDESTDKIEGSVVWQSWTNHEVFALLVKRIETYFGREPAFDKLRGTSQRELATYLRPVMDDTFRGKGHWSNAPMHRVLMSLIRNRPRDLVKLCSLAARDARNSKSSKIYTSNFESIFEEYSQGRVQDTINEFRSEFGEIERLIFGMKPSVKEKTAKEGYVYTTAGLLDKLKRVQEQGQFRFRHGRAATTKDLAAFLYKINFLTARKENSDGIVRRYFEQQRYLQSSFVDFGFDWEIHPAYRWALQPDDLQSIFESLKLSAF